MPLPRGSQSLGLGIKPFRVKLPPYLTLSVPLSNMKTTSFYVPLLTAAYVSAHGFVRTLTINGQPYTGNIPAGTDSPSVIRQINTTFPNYGASNPFLNCGSNATAGTLVANANPGDTLTFLWKDVGLSNVRFYLYTHPSLSFLYVNNDF